MYLDVREMSVCTGDIMFQLSILRNVLFNGYAIYIAYYRRMRMQTLQ